LFLALFNNWDENDIFESELFCIVAYNINAKTKHFVEF